MWISAPVILAYFSRQSDEFLYLAQGHSHCESVARCIAPDLIGMDDSRPSPRHCYGLFEQAA